MYICDTENQTGSKDAMTVIHGLGKYWNQLKGPTQRDCACNLYQTSEQYLYIFDAWIRIRIICELFHDNVIIYNTQRQMVGCFMKQEGSRYNPVIRLEILRKAMKKLRQGSVPAQSRTDSLIHSVMELSSYWETTNCAATQELPSVL
jgi:hypothetical protein